MADDVVIRTKAGVPVDADFENIVTRDGGFTRIYIVIDTDTGRPYTRLSDGTIQPVSLGVGSATGTNTGDVTLAGENYLSIAGQVITAADVNLTTHVTGTLPVGNGGTGATAVGSANQLLGTNAAATGLEYKAVTVTAAGAVAGVTTLETSGRVKFGQAGAVGNDVLIGTASGVVSSGAALGILAAASVSASEMKNSGAVSPTIVLWNATADGQEVAFLDTAGTKRGYAYIKDSTAALRFADSFGIGFDNNVDVVGSISSTTTIRPGGYTVATLPAGTAGMKAYVTDALAPAFLTLLVGGGAAYSGAQYSGTQWVGD